MDTKDISVVVISHNEFNDYRRKLGQPEYGFRDNYKEQYMRIKSPMFFDDYRELLKLDNFKKFHAKFRSKRKLNGVYFREELEDISEDITSLTWEITNSAPKRRNRIYFKKLNEENIKGTGFFNKIISTGFDVNRKHLVELFNIHYKDLDVNRYIGIWVPGSFRK